MNEEDSPKIKQLWIALDVIAETNVDKEFYDYSQLLNNFVAWHISVNLFEEKQRQFYQCWGQTLIDDGDSYVIARLLDYVFYNAGSKKLQNPMYRNPFLVQDNDFLMSSCTYAHLHQQCETRIPKIEIDGDWIESQRVEIEKTSVVNFQQLVGLDLILDDSKHIPDVSVNCLSAVVTSHSETNAALSYMMLKSETKELRKLAKSLYRVLKQILQRKIIVDWTIYFLVCDLHRCAGAAFIGCCPGGLKQEFAKNLFIPLYIPFHQQGYMFMPDIKIETKEKIQLVSWKNRVQKELTEKCHDWYYQFIEETDNRINQNLFRWHFRQWCLFRVCLLIQSDKELDKIEFIARNVGKQPTFQCLDPKQILITKDNFYWYNVSMVATHDHNEALLSNTLYHAKIMRVRYPCFINHMELVIETIDPLTNIRLYSRTLNLLETEIETKRSYPLFSDD